MLDGVTPADVVQVRRSSLSDDLTDRVCRAFLPFHSNWAGLDLFMIAESASLETLHRSGA